MSKYSSQELKTIISDLLDRGHEGDYWDYKREWPTKEENTDLIKDIICFANTTHSRDCFLIYGANDDGTPYLMTKPRHNQNELIMLLTQKPKWAGDNQPYVSLEAIEINGNLYDIVIIYNTNKTPYYLQQDCVPDIKYPPNSTQEQRNEINKKINEKTLHKGIIYVRTEDNSTPFNGIAKPLIIEELWKKRFNLLQPIYEQFIEEMTEIKNWDFGNSETYHNIYRPEFTFQYKQTDNNSYNEFFVQLFPNPNAHSRIYTCNFYGTILKEVFTVSIDGGRWCIPYPKIDTLSFNGHRYFYFLNNSDDMIFYRFLNSSMINADDYYRRFKEHVSCFENEDERKDFLLWIENNQTMFLEENKKNEMLPLVFCDKEFKSDAILGKSLVNLLNKFRKI